MVKRSEILLAIAAMLFTACDSLDLAGFIATGSPSVEERFAESIKWNDSHPPRTITVDADNYEVIFAADLHVAGSHESLVRLVAAAESSEALFLLGDLTDNGSRFDDFDSVIAKSAIEVLTTVGNHDLFFGNWSNYAALYGSSAYTVGIVTPEAKDLYIILDTASGTVGRSQFAWLERILRDERPQYRHCIVGTHTNIIKSDASQLTSGNLPLDETYRLCALLTGYGVDMCIDGHDHYRSTSVCRGVTYITLDAVSDNVDAPFGMILTAGETLSTEFVPI